MGGGDYYAVYGCNNDRRKPDKVIMENVRKLRWYGPKDQKDILKWQKLLYRGGDCLQSLQRFPRITLLQVIDLISALFQPLLKGYTHQQEIKKRKLPSKRKLLAVSSPPPPKRALNIKRDWNDNLNSVFIVEQHGDHIYEVEENTLASRGTPVTACNHCIKLNSVIDLRKKLHEEEKELEKLKTELEGSKIWKKNNKTIQYFHSQVKDNDKMLKFYTGL